MSTSEQVLGKQPIVGYLIELRNRLLYCLIFIAAIFLVLLNVANELYTLVADPLQQQLPATGAMIATEVASPFLTPFKLSLLTAIYVSMPFILFQTWRMVRMGMGGQRYSFAYPFLASTILLFYLGTAFAYFVVFPLVFGFFAQVAPEGVAVMTDIGSYLDFVIKLFFAFGLTFEIPVIAVLLILTGATTRASLSEKRPYVFIACFVLGMVLTPPDIFSQILLAVPMWLLFELGLLVAWMLESKASPAGT